MPTYTKPQRILLKNSPEYTEKWVQETIQQDPGILGLGDLVWRDAERSQPGAGRLDLLLVNPEENLRYEVEIQLGATNESHIIRTIEYWDIERRRYPQYDHTAVIIAEDITSRFLNVITLFNGSIPLIAIQMQGYQVGEHATLVFTTVVDVFTRGLVDEDEVVAPATRTIWEEKAGNPTMSVMDKLFSLVKPIDPKLELKYTRSYVGLARDGQADNFISFRPQKNGLLLRAKIPKSEEIDNKLEQAGIEAGEYNSRFNYYRIHVAPADLEKRPDVLQEIMNLAYTYRHG